MSKAFLDQLALAGFWGELSDHLTVQRVAIVHLAVDVRIGCERKLFLDKLNYFPGYFSFFTETYRLVFRRWCRHFSSPFLSFSLFVLSGL